MTEIARGAKVARLALAALVAGVAAEALAGCLGEDDGGLIAYAELYLPLVRFLTSL